MTEHRQWSLVCQKPTCIVHVYLLYQKRKSYFVIYKPSPPFPGCHYFLYRDLNHFTLKIKVKWITIWLHYPLLGNYSLDMIIHYQKHENEASHKTNTETSQTNTLFHLFSCVLQNLTGQHKIIVVILGWVYAIFMGDIKFQTPTLYQPLLGVHVNSEKHVTDNLLQVNTLNNLCCNLPVNCYTLKLSILKVSLTWPILGMCSKQKAMLGYNSLKTKLFWVLHMCLSTSKLMDTKGK